MSVLTDIGVLAPTVLGSAAAGAVINSVSQATATRRADRRAERDRARDLLAQVVAAAAMLETERAVFRERRDSWRANIQAVGQAMLETAAAGRDGNWLRGAAASVAALRECDAGEGARFTERFQASGALIGPALVQLSLMSPELSGAASRVSEALAAGSHARRRADVKAAGGILAAAVAQLRDAVSAFATPPRRRPWRRSAAPRHQDTDIRPAPTSAPVVPVGS